MIKNAMNTYMICTKKLLKVKNLSNTKELLNF